MSRIYKRKASHYYWAEWRDVTGERHRKSTQTTNLKAATERLRTWEFESSVRRPDPFTVQDALILAGQVQVDKGNSGPWRQRCADIAEQFLIPILGAGTDLNAVNLHELGDMYLRTRREHRTPSGGTVSPSTIRKELLVLHQGMDKGQKASRRFVGELSHLLPDALSPRNVENTGDRWLTQNEFRRLLEQATPHRRDWLIFYVLTGVDVGPLHRIHKTRDIDYAQGQFGSIHVRGTKTAFRDRWIPLSADARAVVDRRVGQPGEMLFGPLWTSSQVARCMSRWCPKAGIENVIIKDLRRTFCSWMCQAGVPELHVIRLMGHSNSEMVRKVYAKLAPETYEQAIAHLPTVTTMSQAKVIPIGIHREKQGNPEEESAENA